MASPTKEAIAGALYDLTSKSLGPIAEEIAVVALERVGGLRDAIKSGTIDADGLLGTVACACGKLVDEFEDKLMALKDSARAEKLSSRDMGNVMTFAISVSAGYAVLASIAAPGFVLADKIDSESPAEGL